MSEELELYKQAYERERKSRRAAEEALETRSRELYIKNKELEASINQMQSQQEALVRAEKLATLGTLVSGVAHEINNPMAFVYANIEMLSKFSGPYSGLLYLVNQSLDIPQSERSSFKDLVRHFIDEEDLEFFNEDLAVLVDDTKLGVERVRDIISSLRSFARLDSSLRSKSDINVGIHNTLRVLHNEIGSRVDVSLSLEDLPEVSCNASEINQVFLNLIINAVHALEGTSKAKLSISTRRLDHQIEIVFEDNGPGIPPEVQDRIFEPFFTTKEVGKGTGMGLSISCGIISDHGGEITLQSDTGLGTRFVITLPLIAS